MKASYVKRKKNAAMETFFKQLFLPLRYQMSINVSGLIIPRALALKISGTVIINLKMTRKF